jgi:uncharacterized protein (TIGR02646 family)
MRHIEKKSPPDFYEEYCRTNLVIDYNGISDETRQRLRQFLVEEQEYLCCYCEKEITSHNKSSNIEHVKPKSLCHASQTDYKNMLASCIVNDSCTQAKKDWFDEELFIHPLMPNCSEYFIFLANGEISSKETSGNETIKRLGLNTPHLKASRSQSIETYLELLQDEILDWSNLKLDNTPHKTAIYQVLKNLNDDHTN